MMYVNKRNGIVAELVEINEKSKQVILQGEKPMACTISTFKRWWKQLESPEVVETLDVDSDPANCMTEDEALENTVVDNPFEEHVVEVTKEKPSRRNNKVAEDEDTCLDGRKYSEIGKEIAKQAEEKAKKAKEKAKKSKKEAGNQLDAEKLCDEIYGIVESFGDEIFKPATDIKMRSFKVGGHMYAACVYSKKSVTLVVKSEAVAGVENVREPYSKRNHMFDWAYRFEGETLSKQDEEFIVSILRASREYRIEKNSNSKATKKSKKEEN